MSINIVDDLPGKGKSSFAIQKINEGVSTGFGEWENTYVPINNFIFVTPYKDEIDRILSNTKAEFLAPENITYKNKSESLRGLLVSSESIVTTHKLFLGISDNLIPLLKYKKYTLIIDETLDIISEVDITQEDIKLLLDAKAIQIDPKGKVEWINENYNNKSNKFTKIKNLADQDNLYSNKNKTAFFNLYNPKIFQAFDDIYILTYLFDGQFLKYYFDFFKIDYTKYSLEKNNDKYVLSPYKKENENRKRIKDNLIIYEDIRSTSGPKPKLNNLEGATKDSAYCTNWFKDVSDETLNQLSKNIENYFKNKVNCNQSELYWTTLTNFAPILSSTKCKYIGNSAKEINFAPLNLRATNKYGNRFAMAYIYNRYMFPKIEHFFVENEIEVNKDLFAVSELIQFIFRGCIRNGKVLNCYIPSLRMRTLLYKWLNHEL
ncbi:MAG: hypothetical protein E6647_09900 [Staphylococcus epidermidis]|nr:hypothetical protein [Staphylococcus epidermidis]MDH8853840.1 hypothetical protein [Staphylococcus epidermidis]MDH8881836.1 hypothetical protein [Staphylococcus epidermidis]MDH8884138.1 hypothetical protein [Staphylococcus epidermidis]MDU6162726.1 hypothetical protein [Staphylococcus epidermidis]